MGFAIMDAELRLDCMLHVSDIKHYLMCHRWYGFSKTHSKEREEHFSFFNFSVSTDLSLRRLWHIENCFEGRANDPNEAFLAKQQEYEWFHNVRLEYRGLRIKIPYLHRTAVGYEIYDPMITMNPSTDEAITLLCMQMVMERLGLPLCALQIVYLNRQYVRGKTLADDALWIASDHFCTAKGNPSKTIAEAIEALELSLDDLLDEIEAYVLPEQLPDHKIAACTGRRMCPYFSHCFPDSVQYADDSIMHLSNSAHKLELYQRGITRLQDADGSLIEGTRVQYAQIMAARNGGVFVDRLALRHWLQSIRTSCLIFLDFEWDTYALPPYEGMHPIQTLPFQYSMHIYRDGVVEHKEFIGMFDCRQAFVEALLHDLPPQGNIFAYNAIGAEILRLQELKRYLPQYGEALDAVIARMVDLAIPFELGMVYDVRMRGFSSLKVLSAMLHPQHTYHELDVSDGLQAVCLHRAMEREPDADHSEKRAQLSAYCSMDTAELEAVYEWLNEQVS